MTENLQAGDRVSFDIEGVAKSPYGFGIVTRVLPNGNTLIHPDFPLVPRVTMTNIKKCGTVARNLR